MRIGLLEDDLAQAKFIQLWLESVGHECLHFTTGGSFQAAMSRDRFELLVFDWMLPDTTGDKVLSWVREHFGSQIPIIFVTMRDSEQDIVAALELGADDYLTKPVKPLELMARIAALARRSHASVPVAEVMRIGPYTLDRKQHTLRRQGEAIELTHKEFELAAYLFENAGRVVSRAQILEEVWGHSAELNTRTVDTHVSRLRNKLDLTPDCGWQLRAVYHHGYRLERCDGSNEDSNAA